jgi:hypothetical protein
MLPSKTARHIEQCESCRRLYETERSVTDLLQSAGTPEADQVGTALHGRIMAKVKSPVDAEELPGAGIQAAIGVIAVAIILMSAVFFATRNDPDVEPVALPLLPSGLDSGQWIEIAEEIENTATSPYREEMQSLTEDLGAAADLLVACLGQ